MKLNNIHDFDSIDSYVKYKIEKYSNMPKNFESLFTCMFDETDNVMAETSDGYRITKITYGAYKQSVLDITPTLVDAFAHVPQGEMIGLYMSNSVDWIRIFWGILAAGYSPLVMNTRLSDEVLEHLLEQYNVQCVVSDGKQFSVKTVLAEEATVPSDKAYEPRPFGREVIFMSSGTTDDVKLCAYNGENFYYQVCDSVRIIEQCPKIKRHYEGELKQLVLLPFSHVFGFIAMYLWFGFFSRTFVFPRDLNPSTIQRTVKKHKVTHIFAVPMVWEGVHKAAERKIKERGDATYARFRRVNGLINRLGRTGDFLAKRFLSEVREGLFGDSICFLITGGSQIKPETLRFFNGIGYHLANGYGMTEIGITSVESSSKRKVVNSASIGAPFGCTEYRISPEGILQVKGQTRASRIMHKGQVEATDYDTWFSTGDMMRCDGGRYYFDGRVDDLIVGEDGENINPVIVEKQLRTNGTEGVCVLNSDKGIAVVASVPGVFSDEALKAIYTELESHIAAAKLSGAVKKVVFTHEAFLRPGEFKLNRRKLAQRLNTGEMRTFDPRQIEKHIHELLSGLEAEIALCFAETLDKVVSEIGAEDDFFRDLEGNSLDYFTLLSKIKARLGVDVMTNGATTLSTVKAFAEYIKTQ